jgi:hypothetical protein
MLLIKEVTITISVIVSEAKSKKNRAFMGYCFEMGQPCRFTPIKFEETFN